jgi:hypothetical protein
MTAYKYEERLKIIYEAVGISWQKTATLRKILDSSTDKTDNRYYSMNLDQALSYIAQKKLILKTTWHDTPFEKGTRSDKLSNWFIITEKGILRLAQKFGPTIIKKEDIPIAARVLLEDV